MTQRVLIFLLGLSIGGLGMYWILGAALNSKAGRDSMRASLKKYWPEDDTNASE